MILVLNCIFDPVAREGFDRRTVPALQAVSPVPLEPVHLEHEVPVERLDAATHLLVSGSELSASQTNPLDDRLKTWIRRFADSGRPVLGICYGHQMIARAIAGDATCRRAERPEFGWMHVALCGNDLFAGIREMVVAHSHYDEVTGLPDTFEVIASTDACAVQAFQVRDLPIWGVQFHPEIGYEQGREMFAQNRAADPVAEEVYVDELADPERLGQNVRLFETFFRAHSA